MIKKDVGVGGTKVDPVTLQIMTNAIYSVADEMVAALIRTSYSTNIKDRRDCSGAVFTREGEIVAQGEIGTPLHLGVMLPAVQTALQAIPPETLQPDDDIIMNTPYPEGPGHLNDMAAISPVFYEGEVVGYVANMAHHVDMGGFAPGSMPFGVWEHYQEGLQVPPVKISKRGRLDEELVRLISFNLRTPVEFKGDLAAQVAANNVGEKRLQALMGKYGKQTVLLYMTELMNYSERRISSAIQRLPKGSFSFEDYLEGDGISTDRIALRVTVTVRDSEILADFSESDPQVLGPLNCRPPSVKACVYYVIKALLDPGLPPNLGAFRPIRVITRPGTLLEAQHPGALCNANIITTQRFVASAPGYTDQPEVVNGASELLGKVFGEAGQHARSAVGVAELPRNAPVEVIESTYPLLIRDYSLVPESAGPGRFRGGYGMKREFEILGDRLTVTLSSDRFELAPWGVFGGAGARSGSCTVIHTDGSVERLGSKITRTVEKGSRLTSVTPGGGGWGNPYERPPERVRRDVIDGLISRESALEIYGVVLNDDLTVNEVVTAQRRTQRLEALE